MTPQQQNQQRRDVEGLRLAVRRTAAARFGLQTIEVGLDDDGRPVGALPEAVR